MNLLAPILSAVISCWTAHWAGAGYVLAIQKGKFPTYAIVRSVFAIGLLVLAMHFMRT